MLGGPSNVGLKEKMEKKKIVAQETCTVCKIGFVEVRDLEVSES